MSSAELPNSAATVPLSERLCDFLERIRQGWRIDVVTDESVMLVAPDGLGAANIPFSLFTEAAKALTSVQQSEDAMPETAQILKDWHEVRTSAALGVGLDSFYANRFETALVRLLRERVQAYRLTPEQIDKAARVHAKLSCKIPLGDPRDVAAVRTDREAAREMFRAAGFEVPE